MASAEPPSSRCCRDKDKKIQEQQKTIDLLQQKFRGVVSACKQAHDKLKEKEELLQRKDQLLIEASVVASSGVTTEQQERICALENSISDLSKLCGDYENQRTSDKRLIERLQAEIEDYRRRQHPDAGLELAAGPSFEETINNVIVRRNRMTQTEPEAQNLPQEKEVEQVYPLVVLTETGVQTDAVEQSVIINRKTELAIVIPTPRVEKELKVQEATTSTTSTLTGIITPNNTSPSTTTSAVREGTPASESPQTPDTPVDHAVGRRQSFSRNRTISESASIVGGPSMNSVSLFYANELARKEIELAEARLQAREYECALREVQWKYNVEKYRLQTRVACLEKQHQTATGQQREGAAQPNLTYVKNVLLRFINTKDKQQKQVMMNALLTALNASESQQAQNQQQ